MSGHPIRVQLSRKKGWTMPPNTAKVDRTSIFGSRFPVSCGRVIGSEFKEWTKRWFVGPCVGKSFATKEEAAMVSVGTFQAWINEPPQRKQRELIKLGLRGKNLACWCALDQPCHADVLLKIANE